MLSRFLITLVLLSRVLAGVLPQRYALDLTIQPEQPAFSGSVRITVRLDAAARSIQLNAKDLTIHSAQVKAAGQSQVARSQVVNPEEIRLDWAAPVGPGPAEIEIAFEGQLADSLLVGPYRKQVDGAWYVFTTFTAIEARRAFPCFDEPRFKTPWQLTLHVPRAQRAFSNTSTIYETDDAEGTKAVRFAWTAPLPSELIAFAVGPFDTLAGPAGGQRRVPVRVVTTRGQAEQGRYAAQVTDAMLQRLERYTGIPYPSAKLDHVALPEGAFGAVENPGLITYQKRGLLADAGKDTAEWRERLRGLMTHELAHQWFGDLVTQAGWQDVWLSEGFATWLAGRMMDEERPAAEKNVAAVAARERIMAADTGPTARPVRLAMQTREEMNDVYSRIVYQKGAAVLLMLEGWQGGRRFQAELRRYLAERPDGNATTDDLIQAVGAGETIHSFLDQPGIPTVKATVECQEGRGRLLLSQRAEGRLWAIPVCWKTDTAHGCTLLGEPRRTVTIQGCPAWIYPNAGGTGYYRTAWTETQLEALAKGGLEQLTAAEKLTLVYDLRAEGEGTAVLVALASDGQTRVAQAAAEVLQSRAAKAPAGAKR